MTLPQEFLTLPIAHRGLHGPGIPENSLAAAQAAIDAGYGIELDIQPSSDGVAMVFHDYDLHRLTGREGRVDGLDAVTLGQVALLGSAETVPTLAQFLDLVAGRVPLLIEIKDQTDGQGGQAVPLHVPVAEALKGYAGPVALMSFNPRIVAAFHAIAPEIPVGLTTCAFAAGDFPTLSAQEREHLAAITDYDAVGASFISHDHHDLDNPRVDALKAMGAGILCWTIRSPSQEAAARRIAHNITFEHYPAPK